MIRCAWAGYPVFASTFYSNWVPDTPCPISRPPGPLSPESRATDAAKGIKGLDGPLLQALATVCGTIDDVGTYSNSKLHRHSKRDPLKGKYVPIDGGDPDDKLDQPYRLDVTNGRASGETDGNHTYGVGVTALKAFTVALKPYGTVLEDSITDWHDELEAAIPPFAALVVQPTPKDETGVPEVRTLHPAPHSVCELCLVLLRECRPSPHLSRLAAKRECCPPPVGPHPRPRLARVYHVAGLGQRCRVLSHSM